MISIVNKLSKKIYGMPMQNLIFAIVLTFIFTYTLMYGYAINQLRFFDTVIVLLVLYYAFYHSTDICFFDLSFFSLVIGYYFIAIYKYINTPLLNRDWDNTYFAWTFPLLYALGKLVVGYKKNGYEQRAFILIAVTSAGMYLQGILNYYMLAFDSCGDHTVSAGFWNPEIINTRNVWDIGFAMVLGSLFYAIRVRNTKKVFFRITVFFAVVAILTNLIFHGRTETMIAVVVFFVLGAIYIISNKKYDLILKHEKVLLMILIILLVLISLLLVAYMADIMGMKKLYDDSFLGRDGGVFNNIRFQWAIIAFKKIFTYEKGGWNAIDDEYRTTHNSWLEFGKNYDDIVFCIILLFLIITIALDVYELKKHGKNHDIVYYAIGTKMGLIIMSIINPDFHQYMDTMAILVFMTGVDRGIGYASEKGDYKLLNADAITNRHKYIVPGFGMLLLALVGAAYIDWWNDNLKLAVILILPMLAYSISSIVKTEKYKNVLLLAMATLSVGIAIYMKYISLKSGVSGVGLYIDPFTLGTTVRSSFLALMILPISVIIGFLFYRFKVNKVITTLFVTLFTGIAAYPQILDGRLIMIREAIKLLYSVTFKRTNDVEQALGFSLDFGKSWIYSSENVMGLTSSHNMWLDFARNYGVIILGILIGFELWSIYVFIKMLVNDEKKYIDYPLTIAFILFNFHFMFEATAFSDRYIFIMGLFVYGMIAMNRSIVDEKETR